MIVVKLKQGISSGSWWWTKINIFDKWMMEYPLWRRHLP
jgi:hypothetical protein